MSFVVDIGVVVVVDKINLWNFNHGTTLFKLCEWIKNV